MKKIFSILLASFMVLMFSCTDQETDNATLDSDSLSQDSSEPAARYFYKHLKGTIHGNLNVTMDIAYDGSSFTGTYYYDKKGEPISITGSIDSSGKANITEDVNGNTTGTFIGEFSTSSFVGTWISSDKKNSFPFELKEDYTDGALNFDAYFREDSVVLFDTMKNSPSGKLTQFFLIPSPASSIDSSFRKKIFQASFGKKQAKTDVNAIMENDVKLYAKDYLENRKDFDATYGTYSYNWENSTRSGVIYNEGGILSVTSFFYEYSGGAHGNYGEGYTVFDVSGGDTIGIKDIFAPGFENKLNTIIEQRVKSEYKIPQGGSLEEAGFLVEDGIKYTDNFYLTKSGIGFLYNPYEIAAYSLGQIKVFIPYNELKPILKKEGILKKVL